MEHIIYRNEDNGYTVFQLNHEDQELTCVGTFHYIGEGELLELSGTYTEHTLYGTQLKVEYHEVKEPEDLESIERYLGSGAIKGVGVSLAGRIVRKFKEEAFRIIEEEPERLSEIKGISERMAREIGIQVEEKREMRKAMIYLQKYGISITLAAKIYQHYGQSVYRVLEENPYQIADHVSGIGFKTADEIAAKVGIHTDSDFRIRSGIFYTLVQSLSEGHIYLPQPILLSRAGRLLGVRVEDMETYIMDLCMEKKVVVKEVEDIVRVYPAQYYYLELNTAKMLHDLDAKSEVMDVVIEKKLLQIEESAGLSLDEIQRDAVKEVIKRGLVIVTGGPGTGKTTTIHAMLYYFEREGLDVYLAAPTGRAAKRMTEATGYEAQTIHRLLEVNGNPESEGKNGFMRNRENPLEADVIIIDEVSMVDLQLMHALLSAITIGTRLVLVGDMNQLPSVGAGSVLKDIIRSECFRVVKLTKIFRQASESEIVVNAHKINNGEHILLDNKGKDFFFLKRGDANTIIQVLITLIQKKLPKYVDASPNDIQVLTPMRKGLLGVERLNEILQKYLNPPDKTKAEKEFGSHIFRVGDKVMQIKNNYQLEWEIATKYGITVDKGLGVFNGDMGIIRDINTYDETVVVEYEEGRRIHYPFKLLDELEHAYAITIHKSQGSEYPAVVIPLLPGPKLLYNRNLL
ncbi:MAG: ATP-dependent RecD-like DNA helicase, partial [Lachnospiraceae bacterium]